jgi:hypothetical protein
VLPRKIIKIHEYSDKNRTFNGIQTLIVSFQKSPGENTYMGMV